MGNVYFNTPARDITLELAKAALEDRERAKQIDLTKLSPRDFLDSFETKNLSDMLYEWYPNYYEKQPMPKSLFGNRFGYDMQKQTDKESIEVGVNDKAVWSLPETALSFTSISIFLW